MQAAWLVVAGFVAGSALTWHLMAGRETVEPYAPQERQVDGSLVLERRTDTVVPVAHHIPAGSREVRRLSVVVQPRQGIYFRNGLHAPMVEQGTVNPPPQGTAGSIPAQPIADSCSCPPIRVDASLVRETDGSSRVIVSSPDGQILSGVDIPMEPYSAKRSASWGATLLAGMSVSGETVFGGILSRRFGPLHVGAGLTASPGFTRPGVIASIGVEF